MTKRNIKDDIVLGEDGNPISMLDEKMEESIDNIFQNGNLVLVIVKGPNEGEYATKVIGPPSVEVLGVLLQTVKAFQLALSKRNKLN